MEYRDQENTLADRQTIGLAYVSGSLDKFWASVIPTLYYTRAGSICNFFQSYSASAICDRLLTRLVARPLEFFEHLAQVVAPVVGLMAKQSAGRGFV